jgi:hypothetical protein
MRAAAPATSRRLLSYLQTRAKRPEAGIENPATRGGVHYDQSGFTENNRKEHPYAQGDDRGSRLELE